MPTPGDLGQVPVVSVSGLTKAYGGVHALSDMALTVSAGSVHAVVGENGAGKSTLMKILAGAVEPDSGEIRIDGARVEIHSPADAERLGVGIVYQELTVFPEQSILANLFVGRPPTRRGLVDRGEMVRIAEPVAREMGLTLPLDTLVSQLTVGEQQLVELTRLLIRRPKILILDEPNSALNEQETERLFGILRQVVESGTTVIYVSHRLEEVFQISDRITVMRGGRLVWTKDAGQTSIPDAVRAMVGMGMNDLFPPRRKTAPVGDGRGLRLSGVCIGQEVRDVSFEVRPGEIVGLAGLEGSGTASLLGAIYGTRAMTSGHIEYPDGARPVRSSTDAARRGISLVPADRKTQGLMRERSIEWNVAQVRVGALRTMVWLRPAVLREACERQIARLRIKATGGSALVGGLSGGNQQKVVVAKWLEVGPKVFLLDDPTRGVDVGAKAEIYRLVRELGESGAIILFRSSELPELVGLADRILIMYRGRVSCDIQGESATNEILLNAINTGVLEAVE